MPGPHVLSSPIALQFPFFVQLPRRFSVKTHICKVLSNVFKSLHQKPTILYIYIHQFLPKTSTSRIWSYWSNVDSFPLPASTVNFQVPLSTGSVEFSSIWQVLSSGLLKVILPLSALEGESYALDKILHMKQLHLIDTNFYK